MDEEEEIVVKKKKSEAPPPRPKPKKITIPRRTPSIVIPPKQIIYITADKTTCLECPCFPKEDPYVSPKQNISFQREQKRAAHAGRAAGKKLVKIYSKLNPCQKSPETLYQLAAAVVDNLVFPTAFAWTEDDVVAWLSEYLELPEYKECIYDNHINGMRLIMLEDPSKLPKINIKNFEHIQMITSGIRQLFGTDFIRFARSVGLPPRKPLTHCTWFKSRTGPNWGIRKNWTRCDILRWMKIINPEPIKLDHWDLVWYVCYGRLVPSSGKGWPWYQNPDFSKTKFARIGMAKPSHIPHYRPQEDICREYLVPRKFRFQTSIPDDQQLIWMERPRTPQKPKEKEKEKKKRVRLLVPKETRLYPKKIDLSGLRGRDLVLARRKMPKPKFLS